MKDIHIFQFTPKGGEQRVQQVHEADLRLVHDNDGAQRLSIWIDTTRPGETTDDRGVPGWDSGVLIALLTDPLQMPTVHGEVLKIPNAISTDAWGERFLYYWDHADFVTARMTVKNEGDTWEVTFSGRCEAGNEIAFKASFPA